MWRVFALIDKTSQVVGKASSLLLLAVVATIAWEVMMRYIFNAPTIWAQETMQYLCGITYMLGGAFALYAGAHVRVEAFYERLSTRKQALLDVATFPFFLVFTGALFWIGVQFASDSIALMETTSTGWAPPIWPVKLTIPLGAILMVFQGCAQFGRRLLVLIGGNLEH